MNTSNIGKALCLLTVLAGLQTGCSGGGGDPVSDSGIDNGDASENSSETEGNSSESNGGDTADQNTPDVTDNQQNDPASIIDAGNFEEILVSTLDVLRGDIHYRSSNLLDQLAEQWEDFPDAAMGSVQHDCTGGGSLIRSVTEVSDYSVQPPDLKLSSKLAFADCVIDLATLNGKVQWDWRRSSVAAIAAENYTDSYVFENFNISAGGSSETLNGSYERFVDVPVEGDGYKREATTTSYTRIQNGLSTTLTDALYSQSFGHYLPNPFTSDEAKNEFTETGHGTVSIESAGLQSVRLTMDPTLVYGSSDTDGNEQRTNHLVSGALAVIAADGSRLDVSVASVENHTLVYVVTEIHGQQTTIEREWLSPTPCLPDPRFRFDSCY